MRDGLRGLATLLIAAVVGMAAAGVEATPVSLTWNTTVSAFSGSWPTTVGEAVAVTFVVDNGGSSSQSQTWNGTDLVSYTITGTSGWSFSSTTQPTTFDYVDFATDSSGAVTTAANWSISPGGPITTSWAGSATGSYANTGSNFIGYESGFSYWLSVNNVAQNQVGSSWTATIAAVPEIDPASFGSALALALGSLGLAERKRRVVIG
jgi:hypothetical protein